MHWGHWSLLHYEKTRHMSFVYLYNRHKVTICIKDGGRGVSHIICIILHLTMILQVKPIELPFLKSIYYVLSYKKKTTLIPFPKTQQCLYFLMIQSINLACWHALTVTSVYLTVKHLLLQMILSVNVNTCQRPCRDIDKSHGNSIRPITCCR